MKTLLAPLHRTSAAEEVLHRLSHAIKSGEIKRGDFLPAERELAVQLGVSRVVVREAARRLEQRGLVSIRHGIGVQVVNDTSMPVRQTINRLLPRDAERLRQSAQARLLVEPELAALAAVRATPSAIARLKSIYKSLPGSPTVAEAADRDIAFHDAIADLAGNKVLGLMLQSVAEIGRQSRQFTLKKFGLRRAHEHHGKILAALAAGNPAAARRAMKAHLDSALADLT